MKLSTQSQVPHLSDQPNQQQVPLLSPGGKPPNNPKPWHSPSDTPRRKAMSDAIIQLLRLEDTNSIDWHSRLPRMAAKLEEALYFSADTLFEYVDVTTLNARLQQLGDSTLQQQQAGNNGSEDRRKKVLKRQQQRLLLLRHAAKCNNEVDCKVTSHCSTMKVLWKHIIDCKEQKCKTTYCVSSRYVLSHYAKCKDYACTICGPVRDAIRLDLRKGLSQAHSRGRPDEQPTTKRAKLEDGVACDIQVCKDRENALRQHLELLKHSAYCIDSTICKEKRNCFKMKASYHLVSFSLISLLTLLLLSVRTFSCTCGTAHRRTRAAPPARRSRSS